MRKDIVQFVQRLKQKYKVEAVYFPDDDIYSIRFRGQAVQNFTPRQFYELPQRHRFNMIGEIINLGLAHNVGEKSIKDKINLNRAIGKKI